ncbi:MAG: hypothetical protein E6G86_14970 [Alphaproteobacteria bacterium]|nr:MAG: hypothetical protein E6G86_14970 [Alphaproteobacteria bacterium]
MTELDMNPQTLPADAQALYREMAARRSEKGEAFGGPYLCRLRVAGSCGACARRRPARRRD